MAPRSSSSIAVNACSIAGDIRSKKSSLNPMRLTSNDNSMDSIKQCVSLKCFQFSVVTTYPSTHMVSGEWLPWSLAAVHGSLASLTYLLRAAATRLSASAMIFSRWVWLVRLSAYSLYKFSVPEGRAANQPFSVTTLRPPIGALLPGACGQPVDDLLTRKLRNAHPFRSQSCKGSLFLGSRCSVDSLVIGRSKPGSRRS